MRFEYRIYQRVLSLIRSYKDQAVGKFLLKQNRVSVRGRVRITGRPYVRNRGSLIIEDGVIINSSINANPTGAGTKTSLVVKEGAVLYIGAKTGLSNCEIYCMNKIWVGEWCLLGGGCKIYDTDRHSIQTEDRHHNPDLGVQTAAVHIGNNAFIGAFSIILKGVTIGDGSVIGAGSVVAKDIPPEEVWAGNPVRFIRKLK